jgi:hypothetical protein
LGKPIGHRRRRCKFEVEREILVRRSAAVDQENITRQSQTTAARDASSGIEKPEKRPAHSGDREFCEQALEPRTLGGVNAQRPHAVGADTPLAFLELGKSSQKLAARAIHRPAQQCAKHALRQRALHPARLAVADTVKVRLEEVPHQQPAVCGFYP